MRYFIIILSVFMLSCATLTTKGADSLQLILSSPVRNGSDAELIFVNKSSEDISIYMGKRETIQHFGKKPPFKFTSRLLYPNDNLVPAYIVDYGCYDVKIAQKYELVTINKFDSLRIKLPFRIRTDIADECYYEYKTEDLNSASVEYIYVTPSIEDFEKELDSLEALGHKVFRGNIVSNRQPLIMH